MNVKWTMRWPNSWSKYAICELIGEYDGKTYCRRLPRMYFDEDREKQEIIKEIKNLSKNHLTFFKKGV